MRPSELIPGADGIRFYMPLIAAALLAAGPRLVHILQVKTLINQPLAAAVFGLVGAVFISHASNGELALSLTSGQMMLQTAVYVLVMITVVTTPERFRTFMLVTILSASVMIIASINSYRGFVDNWSTANEVDLMEAYRDDRTRPPKDRVLYHVVEFEDIEDINERQAFFRMRGFGIFGDPNDLSTLIVFCGILTLFFLTDKTIGPIRFLWLINLALLIYAQQCTQSRGGLVAAAVAAAVFLLMKFGRQVATAIVVLMVASVPLLAGRVAKISLSEGTAQERIQLWAEGLLQLQSGRILFGIGEGKYEEVSWMGLKAHNSYVHSFVELGVFGGLLFFSCAFFPALAYYRVRSSGHYVRDPTLRRLLPYIPATLAGFCFALCALSRCYTPATYMVFGTSAVYVNLLGYELRPPQPIVRLSRRTLAWCFLYGMSVLVGAFVFVKLFKKF